jgi:response regulator NasT
MTMAHGPVRPDAPARGECRLTALRIVAADGDPAMCRFYQQALPALGHHVCVTGSGRRAVELCRLDPPDLVITEMNLPDLDGLVVAGEVCRHRPVPFIVVSGRSELDFIQRAPSGLILAYLVKPITQQTLGPSIAVAVGCFQRLQGLAEEASRLRRELEDRKLIDRAKGTVMRYCGLGEEEAFHQLQRVARNQNRKLVDVAHGVLQASKVFHELEQAEDAAGGSGWADHLRSSVRSRGVEGNGARPLPGQTGSAGRQIDASR